MVYGILTNRILAGATVIGFSRSGDYTSKEFFEQKSEVYSIVDVGLEDIEKIIGNHAKNQGRIKSMFKQIKPFTALGMDEFSVNYGKSRLKLCH